MTISWKCADDKYAPLTTSPVTAEIPLPNPIIQLPALTGCDANATSTTTFTSAFPVRTGFISFEEYQGLGQGDFWNQTDSYWTISIANDTDNDVQFVIQQFMNGDPGSTIIFTMNPASKAFNLTVPSWFGTRKSVALFLLLVADRLATEPGFSVSATITSGALLAIQSYTMVISGEWPCQSDPIANGPYQGATPCVTGDLHFATDTYNWL